MATSLTLLHWNEPCALNLFLSTHLTHAAEGRSMRRYVLFATRASYSNFIPLYHAGSEIAF